MVKNYIRWVFTGRTYEEQEIGRKIIQGVVVCLKYNIFCRNKSVVQEKLKPCCKAKVCILAVTYGKSPVLFPHGKNIEYSAFVLRQT